MPYVKQTWNNGDVIDAEKLNHIEEGIKNAGSGPETMIVELQYDEDEASYSASEGPYAIRTAVNEGKVVLMHIPFSTEGLSICGGSYLPLSSMTPIITFTGVYLNPNADPTTIVVSQVEFDEIEVGEYTIEVHVKEVASADIDVPGDDDE